MDEATLKTDSTCRLSKSKAQRRFVETNTLIVRFTSEWDARRTFFKSYNLKNYHERVSISQSMTKDDQATERELLQKRYEMIIIDAITREKINNCLQLFRNGIEVTFLKWLQIEVCLLNVQSIFSLQEQLKLVNFLFVHRLDLVVVAKTWL